MKQVATAFLLLITACCNAFAAERPRGPGSISELQAAIEAVLKETKTRGAGIAIVSRDKVEWEAGLGLAPPSCHSQR